MHWYAVRVTYSRELFFKEYLDAAGIENYIPMRYEYVVRKERRLPDSIQRITFATLSAW